MLVCMRKFSLRMHKMSCLPKCGHQYMRTKKQLTKNRKFHKVAHKQAAYEDRSACHAKVLLYI